MKTRALIIGLIVIILGLRVGWFLHTHERVEIESREAPSSAVASDEYYGFSRYLDSMDVETQQVHSINTERALPDTDTAMFFTFMSSYISNTEFSEIAYWVASGGHLILPHGSPGDETMLSYLGFYQDAEEDISPSDEPEIGDTTESATAEISSDSPSGDGHTDTDASITSEAQSDSGENTDLPLQEYVEENNPYAFGTALGQCNAPQYYAVKIDGKPVGLVARFTTFWDDIHTMRPLLSKVTYTLAPELQFSDANNDQFDIAQLATVTATAKHASAQTDESAHDIDQVFDTHDSMDGEESLENRERTFAVSFAYGLGIVTVLGDDGQISNENFYQNDHSYTLYKALSAARKLQKVLFVSVFERTNLWDLILQRGAHLVLWLVLGIACFFWWASQRFGRMIDNPSDDRREFREHLNASGKFLWHNQQRSELLEKSKHRLLQRIQRKFPHFRHATNEQQRTHMHQWLENDASLWDAAMIDRIDPTKHQFLEQTKALQLLWKKI